MITSKAPLQIRVKTFSRHNSAFLLLSFCAKTQNTLKMKNYFAEIPALHHGIHSFSSDHCLFKISVPHLPRCIVGYIQGTYPTLPWDTTVLQMPTAEDKESMPVSIVYIVRLHVLLRCLCSTISCAKRSNATSIVAFGYDILHRLLALCSVDLQNVKYHIALFWAR